MASFLNVNLPSEDEEDEDFVPNEVDEDERAAKGKRKAKRLRGAGIGHDTDASDDSQEEKEDEEDIFPESKRAEKKAKVDALWSQMNQGGGAATTTNVPKPTGNINLAALCRKPAATKKPKNGDDSWKRQLGLLGTNTNKKKIVNNNSTISSVTSAAELEKKKELVAAAINAAKDAAAATDAAQRGMVMITETRRFAGQNIEVNREVAAGSKAAQKAAAEAEAVAAGTTDTKPSSSGLDAVLASLAQTKKVTVLDKTRADWKDLKRTDADLKEELESHKRSGTTYLEKQAFLKQAELAEYERERDARLGADVRNRGFLG